MPQSYASHILLAIFPIASRSMLGQLSATGGGTGSNDTKWGQVPGIVGISEVPFPWLSSLNDANIKQPISHLTRKKKIGAFLKPQIFFGAFKLVCAKARVILSTLALNLIIW
jgi:hypothetical protein